MNPVLDAGLKTDFIFHSYWSQGESLSFTLFIGTNHCLLT